jgi:hypothetical protein
LIEEEAITVQATAMRFSPALSVSLLVCLLCIAPGGCTTPPPTLDMPPVGTIALLPTETNLGSEEEIMAKVKNGTPKEIISLGLVELRKKYPDVAIENLELELFTHNIYNYRFGPRPPRASEHVIIIFCDPSTNQFIGEEKGNLLYQYQSYRVGFDMRQDGRQEIFITPQESQCLIPKEKKGKQVSE